MAAAANIYQIREARRENRPLDNSYVCQVKKRVKRGGIFSVGVEREVLQMQSSGASVAAETATAASVGREVQHQWCGLKGRSKREGLWPRGETT